MDSLSITSRMFITGWNLCSSANVLLDGFDMSDVQSLDASYWVPAGSHYKGGSGVVMPSVVGNYLYRA